VNAGQRARLLCVTAALLLAAHVSPVWGHGLDPAYLSLRATGGGSLEVTWRTASERRIGADVRPILPERCRATGTSRPAVTADHVTLRWTVDCGPDGLAGETIAVRDLDAARINALLRIEETGRPVVQAVLHPRRSSFTVAAEATRLAVVGGYCRLGIEHILGGADHLLFVLGLVLLLSASRLLIKTITAFTLGHSITLSAAALGWAAVPSRPVEVLIALSVLALAVELARDGGPDTALRRSPWLMALGFGVLVRGDPGGAQRPAAGGAARLRLRRRSRRDGAARGRRPAGAALVQHRDRDRPARLRRRHGDRPNAGPPLSACRRAPPARADGLRDGHSGGVLEPRARGALARLTGSAKPPGNQVVADPRRDIAVGLRPRRPTAR
jgi:hypothetical protein